jgi:hypothetical protein
MRLVSTFFRVRRFAEVIRYLTSRRPIVPAMDRKLPTKEEACDRSGSVLPVVEGKFQSESHWKGRDGPESSDGVPSARWSGFGRCSVSARWSPLGAADSVCPPLDRSAGLLDLIEIVSREFDVSGFEILFQTAELGRSRYGDDPGLPRQQPGNRDLRRRRLLALVDCFKRSTSAWLAFIASGAKHGKMLRKYSPTAWCSRSSRRSESLP